MPADDCLSKGRIGDWSRWLARALQLTATFLCYVFERRFRAMYLTLLDKNMMVGETGFEPATLWSQTRCATRLRHSPTGLCPLWAGIRVRKRDARYSQMVADNRWRFPDRGGWISSSLPAMIAAPR
jgi:hypothetical protein